jgi:hypothetical protein
MEIIFGSEPIKDGLYIVFVDTALRNGWKEPHIVLWHNGRWNFRNTQTPYPDKVFAYAAIPVMKDSGEPVKVAPGMEFDL